MAKKKKDKTEKEIVAVQESLTKTELFIEKNQKTISIVVGIIIVIILGYFGYKKYYLGPRNKEAQSQMFMAEKYFDEDSLNLALNGDGNYLGFLDIIDDYRRTKSANLSNYYAGICYLKKRDFKNAIDYLKNFNSEDQMVSSSAKGAIGDAYMELGDNEKALDYYLRAADDKVNNFTTPLFLKRAGLTYEILGKYDKAEELYQRIKKDFPRSNEAREIDKYIARAKGLINKK